MTYFIVFTTYILNIINSIKKRRNSLLFLLLIVMLVLLMGGNTKNPDYDSYEIYYYSYGNVVSPDFGFNAINAIFNVFGISYKGFRLIMTIVSFYLIHLSIKKYSANPIFVYLLFAIYPFMLDVVQIRNFIMTSIIIYAVTFLNNDIYRSRLKYIVLVLIASSIHMSALIYLPIILVDRLNRNFFFKLLLLYGIIIGIIVALNRDIFSAITSPIFQYLSQYDGRFANYSSIKTNHGYLLYWGIQLSSLFTVYWSNLIVKKNNIIEDSKKQFVRLVYLINIYLLLLLPFYILEMTFYRYARNILILNYIVYSITYKYITNDKLKKVLYILSIIFLTLFYYYVGIHRPHLNNIVEPLFRYNWILN